MLRFSQGEDYFELEVSPEENTNLPSYYVEFGFVFDPSQLISAVKLSWVLRYAA